MRISDWSSDVCSSDLHAIDEADEREAVDPDDRQREFLAAEPGDGAARAFPALETLGDLAAHDLPRLVPEGVVDRLEAITVDQRSSERREGNECGSTCGSLWSQHHNKITKTFLDIISYKTQSI